jgi:ABC-type sugar transport system ATPase subunit
MNMTDQPNSAVVALETRAISKSFGHVRGLESVDFKAYAGEVVAVVGDNGAGKSTFVKTVAGVLRPDSGQILVAGEQVAFRTPADARGMGVEVVYQDLALAPDLSVWANLFLGREVHKRGAGRMLRWLDKKTMRKRASEELDRLRISMPSIDARVEDLSGGQRQCIAVARSVAWGRKIVLMDEPTAALGVEQGKQVAGLVQTLARRGLAVVLISHNLAEVFEIADRVVVFRQGRSIADVATAKTTRQEVVGWITGAYSGTAYA